MYKEQNKSFHYGIILIVNCSKICNTKVQYFSQLTKLKMFYRHSLHIAYPAESTIVEITNVLQTLIRGSVGVGSTIVEITNVLQTIRFLEECRPIYNSRNYKCFIDRQTMLQPCKKSTIVEIISVLQTIILPASASPYLQQQKL